MRRDVGTQPPANDNRFRVITDTISRDDAQAEIDETLTKLSKAGAVDAVLIEALFSSLLSHASRAALEGLDEPRHLQLFERYNQVSKLAGALELFKAKMMEHYVDRLVQPKA